MNMDWMNKLPRWNLEEDQNRTMMYGYSTLLDKYKDALETIDELQADIDATNVLFKEMMTDIVRLTNTIETNPFIRVFEFFKSLVFQSPIVRK